MDLKQIYQTKLMGILNLTPDSFSDGGKLTTPELALEQATKLIEEGADILDLGGEASGPNSVDVSLEEEKQRVIPILKLIREEHPNIEISIDTYKHQIADEALSLGATYINDITGLRQDPHMAETIAKHNAKVIIMYSKDSSPRTTKDPVQYADVIETIKKFFDQQIAYAKSKGIPEQNIILDPGMGAFVSGDPKYSFEIIERLEELKTFGLPILIGTSKKSLHPQPLNERLIPSIITGLLSASNGANILRVHDVLEHKKAINTFQNAA